MDRLGDATTIPLEFCNLSTAGSFVGVGVGVGVSVSVSVSVSVCVVAALVKSGNYRGLLADRRLAKMANPILSLSREMVA